VSGFLLDTNVISELVKPKPELRVVNWIAQENEQLLHLSVLTLGEVRNGIELLPDSSRRRRLEHWLEVEVLERFRDRILIVNELIADSWGRMNAHAAASGMAVSDIDGLLAATAYRNDLVLVTRNSKDVEVFGIPILNPWEM
jgi:predicted nucleic acid-binding protein